MEPVEACLDRLAADRLAAVVAIDPTALDQARAAARRRAAGESGPLLGQPVLIKDNIAVSGMPTTAGSRALADSRPPDAPLVTRLRAAGVVVVGKANLSEWANIRSSHSTSGWSAIGGLTGNPHVLDRNTSGSSSGSAASVAAGLVPLAVGTETDGSIVSPAAMCGVVGFKPSVGVVPGAGIVPISAHQDTAGPMARTVTEVAALHAVLADVGVPALRADALRGRRVGVWVPDEADGPLRAVLDSAAAAVADLGATVRPVTLDPVPVGEHEWPALLSEFRAEIDAYLATVPGAAVRSLAELIDFNRADDLELTPFGQDTLLAALDAPPVTDRGYRAHRAAATTLARALIDDVLGDQGLDLIMTLSNSPAGVSDFAAPAENTLPTSTPSAVAGYPSLSVPAGFLGPLPIGVTLIGGRGADLALLQYGYAFEQATRARRDPAGLATNRPTVDPDPR